MVNMINVSNLRILRCCDKYNVQSHHCSNGKIESLSLSHHCLNGKIYSDLCERKILSLSSKTYCGNQQMTNQRMMQRNQNSFGNAFEQIIFSAGCCVCVLF